MTTIRAARQDRLRRVARGDDGFSLIETIVAMSIFAVFMGLVMTAIVSMMTSTQKSQSLDDGARTVENVFQKLDHQVRYSDAMNDVTVVSTRTYDEWHSQATATSPEMCTQLKYDSAAGSLSERTWSPTASPVVATSWQLLANNVTVVTIHFTPLSLGLRPNQQHQYLTIDLLVRPHGTSQAKSESSETSATFTAVNSTKNSGTVCQEVGHP
jgi:prepilin-type N-terminal cleavage/methylation domain-containing protein